MHVPLIHTLTLVSVVSACQILTHFVDLAHPAWHELLTIIWLIQSVTKLHIYFCQREETWAKNAPGIILFWGFYLLKTNITYFSCSLVMIFYLIFFPKLDFSSLKTGWKKDLTGCIFFVICEKKLGNFFFMWEIILWLENKTKQNPI